MKFSYFATVADSTSAIRRSGRNSGGGSITYDLSEDEMKALAMHIPLVQVLLRITVEVADEMMQPIGSGKPKPLWAQREAVDA